MAQMTESGKYMPQSKRKIIDCINNQEAQKGDKYQQYQIYFNCFFILNLLDLGPEDFWVPGILPPGTLSTHL